MLPTPEKSENNLLEDREVKKDLTSGVIEHKDEVTQGYIRISVDIFCTCGGRKIVRSVC